MNRRNFLRSLVGGVTATAAVRTWPFRVFSFPSEIKSAYFVPEFPLGSWGAIDRTAYPGRLRCPTPRSLADIEAIELEHLRLQIPELFRNDRVLRRFYSWETNDDKLARSTCAL